jgi:outer membrane protein assembly factor BamD
MSTRSAFFVILKLTLLSLLLGLGCGPKVPKVLLDAQDQYEVAKREFEKEHWNKAVVELQKLIFSYPGTAFIDSAQYLLGMTYFNQEEYPLAIGEFNKLLISYPTSQLADDAAFMVARSDLQMSPKAELDQTHTQKAVDELRNFLDDYPQSDRREEAEELLNKARAKMAKRAYKAGHLYYKMGRYPSALIYFRQVLNDYHDTEWVKQAQFEMAEVFYKQKEYDKAQEEYENFLQDYPDDKLAKKAKRRLNKLEKKIGADSG